LSPQSADTAQRVAAPWTVRPGRPEDAASILDLFEATFGKPASEAWYRWKHLDSPWPIGAPTPFVAAAGERVIGHFAGTPLRVHLIGQAVPAIHGCDLMVAAEFRGEGVMTAVGEAAHRAWAAGGAHLVFAIPVEHWIRDRLGYRSTARLGWLWRPLRPAALVRRKARPRHPGGPVIDRLSARTLDRAWAALFGRTGRSVDVSAVELPGAEFDTLWEEIAGRYDALVVRDRAWVAYRYAAAPEVGYRILLGRVGDQPVGYLVYRLLAGGGRRTGWIVDLFTAPEDRATRSALLRTAFRELLEAGADDARTFAVSNAPLSGELQRMGFIRRSGAYDVGVFPLASDLRWQALRDPGRCLITIGDFDVV
jgi:predicted N-acetyltransferase YhbS